jgi:hypothetical protein
MGRLIISYPPALNAADDVHIGTEELGDHGVYAIRVDALNGLMALLVAELIPDSNTNRRRYGIHSQTRKTGEENRCSRATLSRRQCRFKHSVADCDAFIAAAHTF